PIIISSPRDKSQPMHANSSRHVLQKVSTDRYTVTPCQDCKKRIRPEAGTVPLFSDPLFSVLTPTPAKNMGQPPVRFGITHNAHSLRARRRQSHFLLDLCVHWFCGDTGSRRIKDTGLRGSNRVNRGGGWNNNFNNCRLINRNNNTPTNTNNNIGLRLSSSSRCPLRYLPTYAFLSFCGLSIMPVAPAPLNM
ncbi:MAG TPA: hypothetical protein PLC40_08175, partial [Candidatus Hydrogenedentes bacterium]|nr:hypothetical protein [Candidatus Hydrogenedentota bacterium]